MKKNITTFFFLFIFPFFLYGCQHLMETPKVIWGSSLKELEDARVHADKRTYFCRFEDCYNAILALDRSHPGKPFTKKFFDIFMKDPIRGVIVVMGIQGNIDTTEVGIFLREHKDNSLDVEVTSCSSSAQEKAAAAIFLELDKQFIHKQ